MREKLRQWIKTYHMIEPGDRIVAGVSGGADSVYLFYCLLEYQQEVDFQFCAVHVNHGIRGAEALRDQQYVEAICQKYQVPYFLYKEPVPEIAKEKKLTEEEAGREVRYQAFADCMKQWQGTKVALAHHENDLAETMIHHLARGTGIAGLCSLQPNRDGKIRPLLCMNRAEIEHDLNIQDIQYHTDSTNLETDYTRNKIRQQIIPRMEELNERAVGHMADTSWDLLEIHQYMQRQGEACLKKYVTSHETGAVIRSEILQEDPIMQKYVLREYLAGVPGGMKDVTREHMGMLLQLFYRQVGRQVQLPGNRCLVKTYDGIKLDSEEIDRKAKYNGKDISAGDGDRQTVTAPQMSIPGHWSNGNVQIDFTLEPYEFSQIVEKRYTKWLDYARIEGNVQIRTRLPGDYIVINDTGGRKKLKDYFINEKIPAKLRDQILLVAQESEILWIIGYRINAAYKVTDKTRELVKIQIRGGNYCE